MGFESSLPEEAISSLRDSIEAATKLPITESELYELCKDSPELIKLMDSFMDYASRYALDVWAMQKFVDDGGFLKENGAQEFAAMDDARTRLHNALVDSIAILSRALGKAGKNNEWVRELTNGNRLERSSCGAFALILIYKRYLDKK